MIPEKLAEGSDTYGLLHHLYGPGRRDEHIDPHMVAAWDAAVPDPSRLTDDFSIGDLALLLEAPVHALAGRKPRLHVYHVAVRNAPEDRTLSDAEWAEVAYEMMHAAGIREHTDDQGCRWVAVRHADDHIHIVATKAREDGRQPRLRQDMVKMQAAARRFEERFGLRRLKSGDRTAAVWRKSGELEKAERRGLSETPRDTLQRTVREAAAAATSDVDFFACVQAAGLRLKQRIAPDGNVTGYSVALPGDRNKNQQPVWFSGSRLAPDLSLPRARERWQHPLTEPNPRTANPWSLAGTKVHEAAEQLGAAGLHQGAAEVAALGDLIVVAAAQSPHFVRSQIRQAAHAYGRASRAPTTRRHESRARTLYRESARLLSTSATAARRSDTITMLGFLFALTMAVEASRRWHEAHDHHAQARSAARAGRLLREATQVTVGANKARWSTARRRMARTRPSAGQKPTIAPAERSMETTVRQALPTHAATVLADPAWPALRTRLEQVARLGDDPGEVLTTVATRSSLDSADSLAQVLTWRLDGWRKERDTPAPAVGTPLPATPPTASRAAPTLRTRMPTPAWRPPGHDQHRGPKRSR